MTEIDAIDHLILAHLRKNARLSNKELAARAGVAESTCSERLRRLVRSGLIRGFHADIDERALGYSLQALVSVQLTRHARDRVESFRTHALSLPEVRRVFHMSGRNDFLVQVVVRDAEHLRALALDGFTGRPEVARIETSLIFEDASRFVLPERTG